MAVEGPPMSAEPKKAKKLSPEDRRENALRPCAYLGYERDTLAMYLMKRGMYGLAGAQLRRAVWLNLFEPAFKVHLAWCLCEQERYAEAHDWATHALAQRDEPDVRKILKLTARKLRNPQRPQEKEEMP